MFRLKSLGFFLVAACIVSAHAATTVSGTVTDSSLTSVLKGATVTLSITAGSPIKTATTDSLGAYKFDSVDAGTYIVNAALTGYTAKSVSATVVDLTPLTVDIQLAKVVTLSISGTVTDSTSKGLAGTTVSLIKGRTTILQTVMTDSLGKYSLDNLVAGPYTVTFALAGYMTKSIPDTIVADPKILNVTLAVPVYVTISGTVTDSVTGLPIKGSAIGLKPGLTGKANATFARDTTDSLGQFSVFDTLPASGIYQLGASAPHYYTSNATGTLVPPTMTVNFKLVPVVYSKITGIVTDSVSGNAVKGVLVIFNNTVDKKIDSVFTDSLGGYAIDSVPTGTRMVNFSLLGYYPHTDSVTLATSAPGTMNIKLVKIIYSSVTGTVTDSSAGTAVAGAAVTVTDTLGLVTIKAGVTDSLGKYTLDSIPTGSYKLKIAMPGFVSDSNIAIVIPATPLVLNAKLFKIILSISGTISDSATTLAVAGATVSLYDTATTTLIKSATTDSLGKYKLDSLASGSFKLVVSKALQYFPDTLAESLTIAPIIVDAKIIPLVGVRIAAGLRNSRPAFSVSRSGLVVLRNFRDAGKVSVFNANGRVLFSRMIDSRTTSFALPGNIAKSGNVVLIRITQNNAVYNKQIVLH